MRIAVVSTGLGGVLRGFESFTESFFRPLREYAPDVEVTFFQGGGQGGKRRVVLPNLHRNDVSARRLGEHRANLLAQRSLALARAWQLLDRRQRPQKGKATRLDLHTSST